jgi:hypothetical protein
MDAKEKFVEDESRYYNLMKRARKMNRMRDEGERAIGFGAPSDNEVWQHLRTAMSAIEAGIKCKDWNAIAEGQAMLEKIIKDVAFFEEALLKKWNKTWGGCATITSNYYQYWQECLRGLDYESLDFPVFLKTIEEWIPDYPDPAPKGYEQ